MANDTATQIDLVAKQQEKGLTGLRQDLLEDHESDDGEDETQDGQTHSRHTQYTQGYLHFLVDGAAAWADTILDAHKTGKVGKVTAGAVGHVILHYQKLTAILHPCTLTS